MKKISLKVLMTIILLLNPYHLFFACDSCSGAGSQYKGNPIVDAPGYFAKEFDKVAPAPGMDWNRNVNVNVWFPSAYEKGWVVKTSPKDAIPWALILGFDKSHNVWVGIVREVNDGKVIFETIDDKRKVVQNSADEETLTKNFNLIGYIWPIRVKDNVQQISMEKAVEDWDNKDALFIDVRASVKYKQGHIPGAISIPLEEMKNRLREIPKDKKVLLICSAGRGSSQANLILQSYGFTNTYSVKGGMLEWQGDIEK